MSHFAIGCVIFGQALADLNVGLIAPFFPAACSDRGVSHSTVGAIFTAQQAAALLSTPTVPWLCRRCGRQRVMLWALMCEGVFCLLWAGVGQLHHTTTFVAAAFALRACQGVTQGIFEGASCAMLISLAPEGGVGSVMGTSEAGRAVGYLIGPLVGGLLYQVGGFATPFLVVAGFMFMLPIALASVMRSDGQGAAASGDDAGGATAAVTMWDLIRIPGVVAGCAVNWVVFISLSAFDPTVQPFLAQPPLSMTPASVGGFFALAVLCYIICSVLSGPLAARVGDLSCLNVGLLIAALSLVFTGP